MLLCFIFGRMEESGFSFFWVYWAITYLSRLGFSSALSSFMKEGCRLNRRRKWRPRILLLCCSSSCLLFFFFGDESSSAMLFVCFFSAKCLHKQWTKNDNLSVALFGKLPLWCVRIFIISSVGVESRWVGVSVSVSGAVTVAVTVALTANCYGHVNGVALQLPFLLTLVYY